jgi:hypothetical protein
MKTRQTRGSAFIVRDWSRLALHSVALLGFASACFWQSVAADAVSALFNRTNLQGFYTFLVDTRYEDPRSVFSVTNGMIRISGEGLGYLATKQAYQNYSLVAEFKWGQSNWHWGDRVSKARDSGIFLHATGPDGNSHDGRGAFKAAIECQIMQGAVGDLLLILGTNSFGQLIAPTFTAEIAAQPDPDGWPYWAPGKGQSRTITRWGRLNWFNKSSNWKDTLGFRGSNDIESPESEWTHLECVCDSSRISVFVNGTLVNQASNVFPSRGQILLQCEGSEIFFRKLELHPLSKSAKQE